VSEDPRALKRRLTRRSARRVSRAETVEEIVAGERFTTTSDFVQAIISAEITARKITGRDPTVRPKRTGPPLLGRRKKREKKRETYDRVSLRPEIMKPKTEILNRTDVNVVKGQPYKIVDSVGSGKIREITVRTSSSSNFSLYIETDGERRFDNTYTELATLSPHSSLVDAFQSSEDSSYIVHFDEISFSEGAKVFLHSLDESISFDNIFAVYEV